MPTDDSFTFRETSPGDEVHNQVYLYYSNERHGPYSMVMVALLRTDGTIPKETLYWRQGMTEPRPLVELADVIAASLPRPHHYAFAYKWLPMLVFASPMSLAVRHSTTHQIQANWGLAGK